MNARLDNFESLLLQGKFEPQSSLVFHVRRSALLQRLDASLAGVLTLVVTPAGYGKSTLLSQWSDSLIETGKRVAWLATDETDREPDQFLSHLILSLSFSGVKMDSLEKLAHQGLVDISNDAAVRAIAAVLNKLPGQLVIILDDYHRAGSTSTDRVIESLLDMLPDSSHIAVASRNKPGFRYSALKVNGLVQQFSADDLRFSPEEAREILSTACNEEDIVALMQRTEGWAMALQMARSLLRDEAPPGDVVRGLSGSSGDIADYFAQQVYQDLPDEICVVLRRTSIVERFNDDLANCLSERIDCKNILERLKQQHSLIVSTGRERVWYRYHHLFAEFLNNELERTEPDTLFSLHLRAAKWYESHELPVQAVSHACLAGHMEYASRIIEDAGGWELIMFGGISRFRQLMANFPLSELGRFPRLQVSRVYQLIKEGEIAQAHQLFQSLKDANGHLLSDQSNETAAFRRDTILMGSLLEAYEDRIWDSKSIKRILETEHTLIRSDSSGRSLIYAITAVGALAIGSFEEALEYAKKSQRYMREVNCVLGLNYALLHEGQASLFLGRLTEAIATLDEAHEMAEDNFGADSGLKAVADIIRAAAHYLRDEHDSDSLNAALEYAENYDGWFDVYAAGYGTSALLTYSRKGLQAAISILASGRQTAEKRGLPRLAELLDAYEYLLLVREGDVNGARRLFHHKDLKIRSKPGIQSLPDWRRDHLIGVADGLLALAAGNHDAGFKAAEFITELASASGNRWIMLDAEILRALVVEASGRGNEALARFAKSIDLAVAQGAYRPLLDFGKPLERLLARLYRQRRELQLGSMTHRFIAACLERFKGGGVESGGNENLPLLSPREREVLEHLASGLSNKGIARALDMTENTVKFHLKNIFTKLEVNKRMLAVAAGRNLRLIP